MLVAGGAAAEKLERIRTRVSDGVNGARRDGNGITGRDALSLIVDGQFCLAFENVVDLFCQAVVVRRCLLAWGDAGLGQALVFDAGISVGQELSDLGAIFGLEGWDVVDVLEVHGECEW